MRRLLLTGALLAACVVHGQMLLVEPGAGTPTELRFDPEFIARNAVAQVNGQLWKKPDGRPMTPLDRYYRYRFDAGGQLSLSDQVFGRAGTGMDTASVIFSYDRAGNLLQELHNDVHGYYALRMEYDGQGRVLRRTHVRLENPGGDQDSYRSWGSTTVSDESYSYATLNDTAWTKTFLNDRGRPYRKETWTRNSLGYLLGIDGLNLITRKRDRISFSYNEQGRLAERSEQADLARQHWSTCKWTYDAAGNPLTRDLLRDGVLMRHSEYLYADGSMFLKAIITKNNETGLIDILRYHTERRMNDSTTTTMPAQRDMDPPQKREP